MKHKVRFEPRLPGFYYPYVDGNRIPLLLAHHQIIKALKLFDRFKDWEDKDEYFCLVVAGACKIAMVDKD